MCKVWNLAVRAYIGSSFYYLNDNFVKRNIFGNNMLTKLHDGFSFTSILVD